MSVWACLAGGVRQAGRAVDERARARPPAHAPSLKKEKPVAPAPERSPKLMFILLLDSLTLPTKPAGALTGIDHCSSAQATGWG